jgi:hypothetical protein
LSMYIVFLCANNGAFAVEWVDNERCKYVVSFLFPSVSLYEESTLSKHTIEIDFSAFEFLGF